MKKPKIPQKLPVEIILHKFYTISCCDANTGMPIPFNENFIPTDQSLYLELITKTDILIRYIVNVINSSK